MQSFVIVNVDCISGCHRCMGGIKEALVEIKFIFQDTIDTLSDCIFIAVIFFSHTDFNMPFFKFIDVSIATILYPSIRVMHQSDRWPGSLQSLFEGSKAARQLEGITDIISHNFSGIHICNER